MLLLALLSTPTNLQMPDRLKLYIQTDEITETDSILTVYSVLTAFSDWEYFDSCLYAFSVPIQNMEIEFNLYSTHVQRWNQAEFIHCVPTGISLKK